MFKQPTVTIEVRCRGCRVGFAPLAQLTTPDYKVEYSTEGFGGDVKKTIAAIVKEMVFVFPKEYTPDAKCRAALENWQLGLQKAVVEQGITNSFQVEFYNLNVSILLAVNVFSAPEQFLMHASGGVLRPQMGGWGECVEPYHQNYAPGDVPEHPNNAGVTTQQSPGFVMSSLHEAGHPRVSVPAELLPQAEENPVTKYFRIDRLKDNFAADEAGYRQTMVTSAGFGMRMAMFVDFAKTKLGGWGLTVEEAYTAMFAKDYGFELSDKGKLGFAKSTIEIENVNWVELLGAQFSTTAGVPIRLMRLAFAHGAEVLDRYVKQHFPDYKTLPAGILQGHDEFEPVLIEEAQLALYHAFMSFHIEEGFPLFDYDPRVLWKTLDQEEVGPTIFHFRKAGLHDKYKEATASSEVWKRYKGEKEPDVVDEAVMIESALDEALERPHSTVEAMFASLYVANIDIPNAELYEVLATIPKTTLQDYQDFLNKLEIEGAGTRELLDKVLDRLARRCGVIPESALAIMRKEIVLVGETKRGFGILGELGQKIHKLMEDRTLLYVDFNEE